MPLITQALPNLIGGVSQQPDVTRFEGQCEIQENALSSIVDGLAKRPHTNFDASLDVNGSDTIAENSFVHYINRSPTEKYVVIVTYEASHTYASSTAPTTIVQIYNAADGTRCPVNGKPTDTVGADGSTPITPVYSKIYRYNTSNTGQDPDTYLFTENPKRDLRALTVGDSTFLLNTSIDVGLKSTTSPVLPKEAFCFIKQGDFKKKYGVNVTSNFGTTNIIATLSMKAEVFRHSGKNANYLRVKEGSVGITQAGKFYLPQDTTINITQSIIGRGTNNINDWGTFESASFQVNVNSTTGSITSVDVVNGGRFNKISAGRNSNEVGTTHDFTVTLQAPTGQAYYSQFTNNTDLSTLSPLITSGEGTTAANAGNADTTTIMSALCDNTTAPANQGFTVSGAMDTKDFDKIVNADTVMSVQQFDNLAILSTEPKNYDNNGTSTAVPKLLGQDFDISATDGLGGNGIGVGYKKTNTISDLPTYCKNGFKIEVVGETDSDSDNYWVEFQTTNNLYAGDGVWVETVKPDIFTEIDNNSLPLVLTNIAENTFDINAMNIASRKVGDDLTNPFPSFVGKRLNNLFLYKNRLGFLTEDRIIMSEAGLGLFENNILHYNFLKTTVTAALDTDPIDITVSSGRVTNLKDVVGFQENLILFSENGQFGLRGGDLLTPNNVSISAITNFEFEQNVKPLALGSYIYFPFQRGDFAGIREFTINSTTDNYDAQEITEHIPSYIPSDVELVVGSTSEDIIVAFAPSTPKSLYVYKYFWNGNQKVLSAWSTFTLPFVVRGCEVFEGVLYLTGIFGGKTILANMPLQSGLVDSGTHYNTYLDLRVAQATTSSTNSITLGYASNLPLQVWNSNFAKVKSVTASDSNLRNSIDLSADQRPDSNTTYYAGIPYTMKYQFSEQVFKQPAGNSKAPSGFTKSQIRNGSIFFNNSRGFDIKVKADNRDEKTFTYTPVVIGTSSIGNNELISGNFRFPVFTDAYGTIITIENASALPANFSSAEFEMFVHERSRRFG